MMETPSKRYSPEQISAALDLVKSKRPDLWERRKDCELHEKPLGDLQDELMAIWRTAGIASKLGEMTDLMRAMRLAIRRELGLWV
jgi:hypothetical protein